MLYYDFEVEGKTYKLRLNTRNVVLLEKALGGNPLSIFKDDNTIPTVAQMVAILHASLQQYQHGITLDDTFDLFDKWLAAGHSTIDFINIILEIYKDSGIIPEVDVNVKEKN